MKKLLLLLSGIAGTTFSASAQDIHFSQYDEAPSLVNPALVGSQYVMRASAIYRSQWGSVTVPYQTYGASYEMKFKASNWEKQDPFRTKTYKKSFSRMAGGLAFFSDKAGDGNMGVNVVNLSIASFLKTGQYSMLSVGLQGGVIQKTLDFSKLIFSNQYNGTSGYDPLVPNNEVYNSKSMIYPDFAFGMLWKTNKEESSIGENNMLRGDIGVGVFHITNPKQNWLSGNEKLYSKLVIHSKWLIGIPHSNLGLAPSVLAEFQGPQKEILVGIMAKYFIKDDSKYTGYIRKSSFGIGAYYRTKDALIVSALLEMGQYAVGFSYDLNVSGLTKVSTMRGGPEVVLRFNSGNPFLFQKRH